MHPQDEPGIAASDETTYDLQWVALVLLGRNQALAHAPLQAYIASLIDDPEYDAPIPREAITYPADMPAGAVCRNEALSLLAEAVSVYRRYDQEHTLAWVISDFPAAMVHAFAVGIDEAR